VPQIFFDNKKSKNYQKKNLSTLLYGNRPLWQKISMSKRIAEKNDFGRVWTLLG
jgi:hypothetical protein